MNKSDLATHVAAETSTTRANTERMVAAVPGATSQIPSELCEASAVRRELETRTESKRRGTVEWRLGGGWRHRCGG